LTSIGNIWGTRSLILTTIVLCCAGRPVTWAAEPPGQAELDRALQTVLQAQPGATNSAAVAAAWQVVASSGFDQLPAIFAAMDRADPLAANWLSTAIDRVVAARTQAGHTLSANMLQQAVLDTDHALVTRRLALELLGNVEPQRVAELQAQLLHDPEEMLRRPAVQALIDRAEQLAQQDAAPQEQLAVWRQALSGARDPGQVRIVAREMEKLGQPVDLGKRFGFLRNWQVIGPFDNTDKEGFDAVYPPESLTLENYDGPEGIYSEKTWPGKDGPVSWQSWQAPADSGNVDLNKVLGKQKEVVGYGAAVFVSKRAMDVQLRLRIQNAFKIWLNGQLLMAQPVCHTGNAFDQYRLETRLREGENLILVKSCQIKPPRVMEFYDTWHFGVRLCDSTGLGLIVADRKPPSQ
jgi:hypothetical protein